MGLRGHTLHCFPQSNASEKENKPNHLDHAESTLSDVVKQGADNHYNAPADVTIVLPRAEAMNGIPSRSNSNQSRDHHTANAHLQPQIEKAVLRLLENPAG
jgi:hypothetical protein